MFRLFRLSFLLTMVFLLSPKWEVGAQQATPDRRITEVYGSYTAQLDPAQLAELNGRLLRSSVKQIPVTKSEQFPLLSRQSLVTKFVAHPQPDNFAEPNSINPLKYNLKFHSREDIAYRIDGTDYVLFIAGKAP